MQRPRLALASVVVLGLVGQGASCNRGAVPAPGQAPRAAAASAPRAPASGEVTTVEGVDVQALSATERELFWAVANDELSPCGDPHSLAVCARDRVCATCTRALTFLVQRVQDGFPRAQLGELVHLRFAPDAVTPVRTEGAPVRGAANAPVTLVEFSDYECPHCGHAAPILANLEQELGSQLRVIHMHFPLSGHPHALLASKAAVAAGRQGRFWEFHDLLFAHQTNLEAADLEHYAQQLGLDLARFRTDLNAPETEARVAADRREGERLQIDATPTLFINGRRYPNSLPIDRPQLRQWVRDELAADPH